MKKTLMRLIASYLVIATGFLGFMQPVQAAMIATDDLVQKYEISSQTYLQTQLERKDIVDRLEAYGVSADDARDRVARLTEEEATMLASQMDSAPAGGIIDAIVFVFLVLLFTDILGFTKVFPFTRSIRR